MNPSFTKASLCPFALMLTLSAALPSAQAADDTLPRDREAILAEIASVLPPVSEPPEIPALRGRDDFPNFAHWEAAEPLADFALRGACAFNPGRRDNA